jgi:GT2 family glycosyltransferase
MSLGSGLFTKTLLSIFEMHVSLLSYNHPQHTTDCLQSILRHVPAAQVTLLHNGSRPEVVSQLQLAFPKIEHHVLAENRGFTGGANAALKQAFQRSDWCFFITNDCLLETAPTQPTRSGLWAPMIWRRKSEQLDSCGGSFSPLTGKLRHFRDVAEAEKRPKYGRYFYVPGTAFYIDRSTFTALSGFDESLHTYWEDVDFSVRAFRAGHHLGICENTHVRHKIGKTCHKDPFYTRVLFQRNRRTVSARYSPSLWRRLYWRT